MAIAAHCVAMLPVRDHGALAVASRFLARLVMLPAAVVRTVTYRGGRDAATGLLPAGLRRLPLVRLDVHEARISFEQLVAQGGDGDGDDQKNKADRGVGESHGDDQEEVTPTAPARPKKKMKNEATTAMAATTGGAFSRVAWTHTHAA